MKKFLTLFLIILTAVLNIGCNKKSPEVTLVTTGLKFTLETTLGDTDYEYAVEIDKNGRFCATAVLPQSLEGLTYHTEKGQLFAEFKGLETEISSTEGIIPTLYGVFSNASQGNITEADGSIKISGETPVNYCLFVAQTGLPLKLETDSGLVFYFKNPTII